jgi:hypothetical protein
LGLLASFGTVGDCYDNAAMESFWARLQVELLNTRKWATTLELAAALADYFDNFYNVERRHSYLGNTSPTKYETLWTSTYSVPQLAQPWLKTTGTDQVDSVTGTRQPHSWLLGSSRTCGAMSLVCGVPQRLSIVGMR